MDESSKQRIVLASYGTYRNYGMFDGGGDGIYKTKRRDDEILFDTRDKLKDIEICSPQDDLMLQIFIGDNIKPQILIYLEKHSCYSSSFREQDEGICKIKIIGKAGQKVKYYAMN